MNTLKRISFICAIIALGFGRGQAKSKSRGEDNNIFDAQAQARTGTFPSSSSTSRQFQKSFTSSASRPVESYGSPPSSYGAPATPDIRILPLPIPVGLPVPGNDAYAYKGPYNYGYYNKGYPNYGYPGYGGLFAGFGGPLSHLLKEDRDGYAGLGYDPIKASLIAGRSNPLIHLLAAPYIKNIRENNGRDLPTLDDIQELLESSTFGLAQVDKSFNVARNAI